MRKESLTQEELDSLLDLDERAEESPEEGFTAHAATEEPTTYDFFQERRFVEDAVRTLYDVHSRFISNFRIRLSGHLRTMFDMKVALVEQKTFDEFRVGLPQATFISVCSLQPLEGSAMFHIDPKLAFIFLDRLLGGMGETPGDKEVRQLTPVEMRILRSITKRMYESLSEAWSIVYPITPTEVAQESVPEFVDIGVMPDETVVHIGFDVSHAGYQGSMDLCLPYVALQPIRSELAASRSIHGGTASQSTIQQHLMRIRVPVRVILAEGFRTLGELLDIEKHDVVPFMQEATKPATVMVGRTPRFTARPGIGSGRRYAVKLVAEIREEERNQETDELQKDDSSPQSETTEA